MIKNYLHIAFRVFKRDKAYSLVNLLGLVVGITSSALLFAYAYNESLYDKHHQHRDRIRRVVMNVNFGDEKREVAVVPAATGEYLKQHAKGVEAYAMLRPIPYSSFQIKGVNDMVAEEGFYYANQGVLAVFSYRWLAGDINTALSSPRSVVFTKSVALKYFETVDEAVGGIIVRDNDELYTVTGVIDDITERGHFNPRTFVSLWDDSKTTNWRDWNWCTYLLLTNPEEDLQPLFQKAFDENLAPSLAEAGGGTIDFLTQPLTDIYYESRRDFEMEPNEGNRTYIVGFTIVGGFLLALAAINYINLVTAQAETRAREVGVKKAFGVSPAALRWQFLAESLFYVVSAVLLSAVLVLLAQPLFAYFSGGAIPFSLLLGLPGLAALLSFILFLTLLSGLYPAFFISSVSAAKVLKTGGRQTGATPGAGISLKKLLIVVQLSVSLLMMVGIAVVYLQLRFVDQFSLGFNKEGVLKFSLHKAAIQNYRALRDELMAYPSVTGVGAAVELPGEKPSVNDFSYMSAGAERREILQVMWMDEGFFPTLNIPLIKGSNFRHKVPGDTTATAGVIVNRAFVEHSGWSLDEVVGMKLSSHDWSDRIVGVAEDFHVVSLHDKIEPMVYRYNEYSPNMLVRFNGPVSETLQAVESATTEVAGEKLTTWSFLDQDFQKQYEADEKRANLLAVFACVVLFIACLGLLGLSSYQVRQRNKEIALRKILGASSAGIVAMLSRAYVSLLLWAALLSVPVGNYVLTEWLAGFAYHIEVAWWMLLLPVGALAVICFGVVSVQSLRATKINPATCLRHE